MADLKKINELILTAEKCRRNVLRMVTASGHGHIGGAFSCIDIVTVLYFYQMNIRPQEPQWENRDRFILSAGHKCMAQYAVLAEKGYFEKEILDTYGSLKTKIPGHPDMHKLPGIEANTGALGHGLSIAVGQALTQKDKRNKFRVYVVMGDGELAEGSNWEAVMAAAHYKLDNLVLFLDYNGLQISGKVEDVMNLMPTNQKFSSFGWNVQDIDGNSMEEIINALNQINWYSGKPTVIIAHTCKGKGISFLENQASCHYWSPNESELKKAVEEIGKRISVLQNESEE